MKHVNNTVTGDKHQNKIWAFEDDNYTHSWQKIMNNKEDNYSYIFKIELCKHTEDIHSYVLH